jgi:hypothetical protein
MSRLTLKIKKTETESGYIVEATNGDRPFEGRIHATRANAARDIEAAYNSHVWDLRKSSRGYSIKI